MGVVSGSGLSAPSDPVVDHRYSQIHSVSATETPLDPLSPAQLVTADFRRVRSPLRCTASSVISLRLLLEIFTRRWRVHTSNLRPRPARESPTRRAPNRCAASFGG